MNIARYADRAQRNGISRRAFYDRVERMKMTPELAAKTPKFMASKVVDQWHVRGINDYWSIRFDSNKHVAEYYGVHPSTTWRIARGLELPTNRMLIDAGMMK